MVLNSKRMHAFLLVASCLCFHFFILVLILEYFAANQVLYVELLTSDVREDPLRL